MMFIKDVTSVIDSWKVRVIVEEKTQPRTSSGGSIQYQRLVLADETKKQNLDLLYFLNIYICVFNLCKIKFHGQKVVATIFGSDIGYFKDSFCLYNTYVVSNAKVKRCDPKYDKFNYPYQWTINLKTAHNAETEKCIAQSVLNLQFATFINLKEQIGNDNVVDILAIVVDKKDQRSFTAGEKEYIVKEYAMVNEEKKVVILTLWNAVAESEGNIINSALDTFPVLRVSNLSVSAHYDGSFGSTPSTAVLLDPAIPEADELRIWRSSNLKYIVETSSKDHFVHTETSESLPKEEIYLIEDVLKNEKVEKFTVQVKARIVDLDQKFFYMACGKCYSGINAEYKYEYTCVSCKRSTKAEPREKVHLNIFDQSGSLDVTVFGPQAIKILQMDSVMCMDLCNAKNSPSVNRINETLSSEVFLMKIRKRKRTIGGIDQYVYAVGNLSRIETVSEEKQDKHELDKEESISPKNLEDSLTKITTNKGLS
ncbi:hypothetical protein ACJIZ3_011400 [Penstemon smallii]|uniref:Replication factor A C-terminal domain-containing protein n=1 Tax=Penstemon smallii TaxID=265156 RepID=A0ABD3ULU7_9LAMI